VLQDGKTMATEDMVSVPAAGQSAVGGLLRAARQRHGLAVEDVALALKIRRPYIEAIEEGRLSALPAQAYAIGFVKTYAAALGLDAEEVARRWRLETGAAHARKPELSFPAPVPERGIPAGALIVVGLVLAAGLYGGWYYLSGTGQRVADLVPALPERYARIEVAPQSPPAAATASLAPSATPNQPPVSAAPLASALPPPATQPQQSPPPVLPQASPGGGGAPALTGPVPPAPEPRVALPATGPWPTGPAVTPESLAAPRPAASPTSASASTLTPPPPPPQAEAPAQSFGTADESRVLLRARADSWIQVRERNGGTVLFNRVLRPGETYRVPLRPGLLLTTGNAGGLEIVLDGYALPTLGQHGVVRRDLPLEPELLKQAVASLQR